MFKRLALSAVRRRNGRGKSGSNKIKSKVRMQVVRAGGGKDGGEVNEPEECSEGGLIRLRSGDKGAGTSSLPRRLGQLCGGWGHLLR